jgi:predicted nuclease with TOPRIM domain
MSKQLTKSQLVTELTRLRESYAKLKEKYEELEHKLTKSRG